MTPLEKIYWLRAAFGLLAALLCGAYGILVPGAVVRGEFPLETFMNSLSIALVIYMISYYAIRGMLMGKVEKPQKIMTMGIGIYFFIWLVFWILLYTIIAGAPIPQP